jgi:hypothetical protein
MWSLFLCLSMASPEGPALQCKIEASSYQRAFATPAVKKAQSKLPGGVYFMSAGRRNFVFGNSWSGEKHRAIVWDFVDERVRMELPSAPAGVVERASDGYVAGVLLMQKTGLRYEPLLGDGAVTIKLEPSYWDTTSTVLDDDGCTAFIAMFDRIATGSALVKANLCTGALVWKADVKQLNVAHSKYFNDVSLERRGNDLVMRGIEAGGCYEQTFDAATGARTRAVFSGVQR